MIPFDFEYYRPSSIKEALETYQQLESDGKQTMFISGGTEFITFARTSDLYADAIIDLKGIPECSCLEQKNNQLVIGTAVTLNRITESKIFPLLGEKVKGIADHTSRNKITIGGNVQSQLIYKEAVLPLILAEAKVKIAGKEQLVPLEALIGKPLTLKPKNFLIQFQISSEYAQAPFVSLKKTRFSKVGYPLVSLAAMKEKGKLRLAISGVCETPFRAQHIEEILNDSGHSVEEKIDQAIEQLPAPVVEDYLASASYRIFLLKNTLQEMMETMELIK